VEEWAGGGYEAEEGEALSSRRSFAVLRAALGFNVDCIAIFLGGRRSISSENPTRCERVSACSDAAPTDCCRTGGEFEGGGAEVAGASGVILWATDSEV